MPFMYCLIAIVQFDMIGEDALTTCDSINYYRKSGNFHCQNVLVVKFYKEL